MENKIVLDGFLRKDAHISEKVLSFNFNMRTASIKQSGGSYKSRYSSMKVIYFGEQTDRLKNWLKEKNPVRVYGKIDTEVYQNKDGKNIYNIIIVANNITKISFEKEMKDGKEVSVVKEEVL